MLEWNWYFYKMHKHMYYIVVKFQGPIYNTFWLTDRQKVMHKSPATGGLKNYIVKFLDV